jgi:osmotically-inducible protein OsmY
MLNGALLAGVGLGATLAFMFDPRAGARRRALARDKAIWGAKRTARALDATSRDITHRAVGIAAATRGRWSSEDVDDATLVERVRAKLGRVCSHPHALDVEARDGDVTLRGPILADEVEDVLAMTASVRGVRSVANELEPHESPDGIPSLQGDGRVAGPTLDILQRNWAPATRAVVAMAALATGVGLAMCARR